MRSLHLLILSPGRAEMSTEPRLRRGGHVDNTIVVWIVLIIVAVAVPSLFELSTGQTIREFWRGLPQDRTGFVVRSVVALVAVMFTGGVAAIAGGHRPRIGREGRAVVIGVRQPGLRTLGVGLCLVALYAVCTGVAGHGPFWWIVLGVGAAIGLLGLLMIGTNDRIVVERDGVRTEHRTFRSATVDVECPVPGSAAPAVTVDERSTGGAFGQPVEVRYIVRVGSEELYSVGSEVKAEALREAVERALEEVRGEEG